MKMGKMKVSVWAFILFFTLEGCNQHQEMLPLPYDPENLVINYYADSTIESFGVMIDGKEEGKWSYFRKDGMKMREIHFREGKWHGDYIEFRYGNVFWVQHFVNDRATGKFTVYNPYCNTLAEEGYYIDGKLEGLYYEYFNGTLFQISRYENDKSIEVVYQNPTLDLEDVSPFPNKDCFPEEESY